MKAPCDNSKMNSAFLKGSLILDWPTFCLTLLFQLISFTVLPYLTISGLAVQQCFSVFLIFLKELAKIDSCINLNFCQRDWHLLNKFIAILKKKKRIWKNFWVDNYIIIRGEFRTLSHISDWTKNCYLFWWKALLC